MSLWVDWALSLSLSPASGSDVRSQPLLQLHACLPAVMGVASPSETISSQFYNHRGPRLLSIDWV